MYIKITYQNIKYIMFVAYLRSKSYLALCIIDYKVYACYFNHKQNYRKFRFEMIDRDYGKTSKRAT